jgi:hypothetical protein
MRSVTRQNNPDPEDALEATLNNYSNKAYRMGTKMYNTTQKRKAEGKQIFFATTKHLIGETTRAFLGPRKKSVKIKKIRRK